MNVCERKFFLGEGETNGQRGNGSDRARPAECALTKGRANYDMTPQQQGARGEEDRVRRRTKFENKVE